MLEIENLQAGYGELKVLKSINMEVKPNTIVALIGPNGAGKSTVLKSIFNITTISKGKIIFEGRSVRKLKTYQLLKRGISYVPQGRINFTELTVLENLELGGDMIKSPDQLKKRLKNVFERFPVLQQKKNDLAFSLSGGQQQMLALGRALMQDPQLLLLDEPTLGLSPKLQKELFKTLQTLKKDLSILIVEQNAKKAIGAADHTYLLEDGKIALHGSSEMLKNPKIKNIYLGGRY
jgi:branched-chain amino acid transport system ATP-binding protein